MNHPYAFQIDPNPSAALSDPQLAPPATGEFAAGRSWHDRAAGAGGVANDPVYATDPRRRSIEPLFPPLCLEDLVASCDSAWH